MSRGRRLLFISPVMPAEAGNGLAMRAGLFLEALAADHEVSLLVVPVSGPADESVIPEFVSRLTVRAVVLRLEGKTDTLFRLISRLKDPAERAAALAAYPKPLLCRFATTASLEEAAARFAGCGFDVVHVFRLYMAPFAGLFLRPAGRRGAPVSLLDLDDDEPRTRGRLAALHARRGETEAAALEAREADKYARLEREHLPRFDRVLVCSEADRVEVERRVGVEAVEVIPNAIRVPPAMARTNADRAGSLLFVGTLGYAPNGDAAEFFCHEVLPRLRALAGPPARVAIVGSNPGPSVLRLSQIPEVTVAGNVPSMAPYYAAADVAVVPVRAGGGTRIKVLEAFAYRVPVVATAVGVEGLDVEAGLHLLVADGADEFATACARLLRDPALALALAERAHALLAPRYAFPTVAARIRELYRSL